MRERGPRGALPRRPCLRPGRRVRPAPARRGVGGGGGAGRGRRFGGGAARAARGGGASGGVHLARPSSAARAPRAVPRGPAGTARPEPRGDRRGGAARGALDAAVGRRGLLGGPPDEPGSGRDGALPRAARRRGGGPSLATSTASRRPGPSWCRSCPSRTSSWRDWSASRCTCAGTRRPRRARRAPCWRPWLVCLTAQPLQQRRPDGGRVGGAAGLAHGRADEHAEELLLAGAVALDLGRVRGERPRHRGVDRAASSTFSRPSAFMRASGSPPLATRSARSVFARGRREPARVDERDEPAERGAARAGARRASRSPREPGEVVQEPARGGRAAFALRRDRRVEVGRGRGVAGEEVRLVLRRARARSV